MKACTAGRWDGTRTEDQRTDVILMPQTLSVEGGARRNALSFKWGGQGRSNEVE